MPFLDRDTAGRELAAALAHGVHGPAVVYGLPPGGFPVAAAVAEVLRLPLDVVVVQAIDDPSRPDTPAGAVAESGDQAFDTAERPHLDPMWLGAKAKLAHEAAVAERLALCGNRPRLSAAGQCAIVVDDGLLHPTVVGAAVMALRAEHPARVIVAAPVARSEVIASVAPFCDEVVTLAALAPAATLESAYVRNPIVTRHEMGRVLADHHRGRSSLLADMVGHRLEASAPAGAQRPTTPERPSCG